MNTAEMTCWHNKGKKGEGSELIINGKKKKDCILKKTKTHFTYSNLNMGQGSVLPEPLCLMLLQCTLVASSTEDKVINCSSHLRLNLWESTLGGEVIQVNFRGPFSGVQSVRTVRYRFNS